MSRFHAYKDEAIRMIQDYRCEEPFSSYLKKQFARDRRKGSRDRKMIADLCYRYYRTCFLFEGKSSEEKLVYSLFLTTQKQNDFFGLLSPELNERIELSIDDKLKYLNVDLSVQHLFPFISFLSVGIHSEFFQKSFLSQPPVFIRIRPGYNYRVIEKLKQSVLPYDVMSDDCLSLPAGSKLDLLFELNKEVVVQDMSSQKIIPLLLSVFTKNDVIYAWDCCAASGGKSIHLYDLFPNVNLIVSDIRPSILRNLENRFKEAGVRNYDLKIADLSLPFHSASQYDLIIADVPCSGSGTWRRTPEQMKCFASDDIQNYVSLQRKIITNVLPSLKKGGYFLYSTCSAFAAENEEQTAWMEKEFDLQIVSCGLIDSADDMADTMYAAIFKKQ